VSKDAFDRQRAALAIDGTATEKHVLLVLATRGDAKGQCSPGIPRIALDTGLSERSVHRALVALEAAGHITRAIKQGIGTVYTVHPCQTVTPDIEAPLTQCPNTPDTVASKQPRTTNTSTKASPSSRSRETRVPPDFLPIVKPKSITGKAMAGWPPGEIEEQVEHFIDHHTAKGTMSLSWQASWRTWVKLGKRFNGKRPANDRSEPQNAMFRAAQHEYGAGQTG
jgi:hypothetical protein